jgi:hypothetical protein
MCSPRSLQSGSVVVLVEAPAIGSRKRWRTLQLGARRMADHYLPHPCGSTGWVLRTVNNPFFCGSCILTTQGYFAFCESVTNGVSGLWTMLQKQDGKPSSGGELISPAVLPLLGTGERPAPIAVLSHAKRAALVAFLYGGGTLHKSRGVWTARPVRACDKPIFGITIADLSRDGMLTLTVIGKSASARLTPRGSWFARTVAAEMAGVGSRSE